MSPVVLLHQANTAFPGVTTLPGCSMWGCSLSLPQPPSVSLCLPRSLSASLSLPLPPSVSSYLQGVRKTSSKSACSVANRRQDWDNVNYSYSWWVSTCSLHLAHHWCHHWMTIIICHSTATQGIWYVHIHLYNNTQLNYIHVCHHSCCFMV